MNTSTDTGTVSLLLTPDLVGILISYFLYGALFLQMFTYITHFRHDQWVVSMTVYGVFLLETLLLVITTRIVYNLLCAGWGDPQALARLSWEDAFVPILSGIISGGVQTFYAVRIHILGRKTRTWTSVAIATVLLMIASTMGALYAGFATIDDMTLGAIHSVTQSEVIIWLVGSMVCDIMIALSMTTILAKSRKLLRWSQNVYTEQRLTKVIQLCVEAGFLTLTGTIVMLSFFFALPRSRLFTVMGFINSKLYSNSLMAQINYRVTETSRESSRPSPNSIPGGGFLFNSGNSSRRAPFTVLSPSLRKQQLTHETIAMKRMTVEGFDDAGNAVSLPDLNMNSQSSIGGSAKEVLAIREEFPDVGHAKPTM